MKRLLSILGIGLLSGCLGPLGLPAPQVSIEPVDPGPDDDLVLVLEELASGEGAPAITFQITWQQDGATVDELAGAELVASSWTEVGEIWTATVAAVQGDQVGPAGEASVTIGAAGDDDDTTGDDDDDTTGDDDDDVTTGEPGPATRLCAAAGTVANGVYTVTTCTGPVEAAPGVMANDTYSIQINKLSPMTK